jgi:hypothetical protein
VEHAAGLTDSFPWRAATFILAALAALELVALIVIGAVQLAPKRDAAKRGPLARQIEPATHRIAHVAAPPAPPAHPLRARSSVSILVLNGNGVQGAASSEAARLRIGGYRRVDATNAARHDYARSMVMYVPGWVKEARRLARDAGVRLVAPIDGGTASKLKGAKLVLLLGT